MLQSPLFTLAFWLLLFPSLWASGSLPGFREKNPLLAGILKLALGLGIFAHFLILVAAFGAFKSYSVLIFLAFFLILSWRKGREVFDWLKDGLKSFWSDSSLFTRNLKRCSRYSTLSCEAFCNQKLTDPSFLLHPFLSTSFDERPLCNRSFL